MSVLLLKGTPVALTENTRSPKKKRDAAPRIQGLA